MEILQRFNDGFQVRFISFSGGHWTSGSKLNGPGVGLVSIWFLRKKNMQSLNRNPRKFHIMGILATPPQSYPPQE